MRISLQWELKWWGVESAKIFMDEYLSHTFDPNSRSAPKVDRINEYERRTLETC